MPVFFLSRSNISYFKVRLCLEKFYWGGLSIPSATSRGNVVHCKGSRQGNSVSLLRGN